MTLLELVAAALGVVTVWLVVRRSVWNYPFAILMVSLYFFVFVDAKLYSDALLQIFFLVLNLYGWRNWLNSPQVEGGITVEAMANRARFAWLAATLAAGALWGFGMARLTDAAAPFADAAIAALSVAAQWLQALRRVESWVLWIAVDTIAIGLFYSRGLYPTAALYALFLVLAITGLVAWTRRLRALTSTLLSPTDNL
ncbi:MAG: nicotinamide riboside transporter PnuC [Sphingosinicella sp.]